MLHEYGALVGTKMDGYVEHWGVPTDWGLFFDVAFPRLGIGVWLSTLLSKCNIVRP